VDHYSSPLPPPKQSSFASLLLAVLVHALLGMALFFGVQWKSHAPTAVSVEVWRSAPTPRPKPEVKPVVKPEPVPEPPPPPKVEPKPEPIVEPAPVIKPDIAIKEEKPKKEEPKPPEPKKEEPKKPEPKKEEPKKPEPKKEEPKKEEPKKEEPKKEEPKKPEPKKPEPKKEEPKPEPIDFSKELANDLKKVDQQKVLQDQQARAADAADQLSQLLADQASAGRARGLADYIAKITGKIRGHIVLPRGFEGNPESIFEITQLPTGEVLSVKLKKSSGNKPLDEAVERAIWKSSPLPKPDQPELFDRVLEVKFSPQEK
jgi:colicin import membrane protein